MKKNYIKISVLIFSALTWSGSAVSCSHSNDKEHTETHDDHDHDLHSEDEHHEDEEHEGHDHSGLIELKTHTAEKFGVQTERISPASFSDVTLVSGRIESKASDEGIATATRSGILTLSPNINTGVRVSAGSALGSISASNVQGGDPSVQAIAAKNAAKRELDRLKPLHEDGIVSTEEYNNALRAYEEAEASVKLLKQGSVSVNSPKTGVITQLFAKSGEYVEIGQRIAAVSGNTSLTLRADVPEKYISRLSGVTDANFRPASSESTYNVKDLGGKIISNPGSAVAENGYIPLYFTFTNNGEIAPGAFAEIYLISESRGNVLSVPKEAIVEISGNKCIYTTHGDGHYMKHVVTTGASDGNRIEIISGLEPNEEVVVKGAQVVRMAETSATAVPGHTHNH
ncbi:MAG: efflux RND transporter periplasmic adaptor subunit [Muribaculaceae bacterium]|nr:efflux RND transporter periplasmic adaptor subunit [Muribaculaceae bacterium]